MRCGIWLLLATTASFFALPAFGSSDSGDIKTKVIPLPVIATEPTEGNTYGFMPAFIRVRKEDESTASIIAPSVTWNAVIHDTATVRWYNYPNPSEQLVLIPSISTKINYGLYALWRNQAPEVGKWNDDVQLIVQRSVFFRFFGLGPESIFQTSYTRLWTQLLVRRGLNLASRLNLGARLEFRRDIVQDETVPNLPSSPGVFPGAPGMAGAATMGQSLELRYDTRPEREYSDSGWFARAAAGYYEGLSDCPDFGKFELEGKALFEEYDWLKGAARVWWQAVTSPAVPFYYQSSLGGENLLRGYLDDRFIDEAGWEAEFEQRIRLFQTHIYGVTTDWRVDPFVAVGQVYGSDSNPFQHPRFAAGLGFRAFVPPNVLGRVDVAYGEGWNIYVDIGYPY